MTWRILAIGGATMKRHLALFALVSVLLAGCGSTIKIGAKVNWRDQEYVVVKPVPRGTPITCNLGSLTYGGATYAVCTAPRRLIFHDSFMDHYTFMVIQKKDSSWVAVELGEH